MKSIRSQSTIVQPNSTGTIEGLNLNANQRANHQYLLASPVGHPVVLQLILQNPDDDRVGDGSADVGSGDGVQALVLGDVVLEEEGVRLRRVVVSLNSVSLLELVVVLVPGDLGPGDAEDVALDLAAVDSDQVDLGGSLDEL